MVFSPAPHYEMLAGTLEQDHKAAQVVSGCQCSKCYWCLLLFCWILKTKKSKCLWCDKKVRWHKRWELTHPIYLILHFLTSLLRVKGLCLGLVRVESGAVFSAMFGIGSSVVLRTRVGFCIAFRTRVKIEVEVRIGVCVVLGPRLNALIV